MKVTASQISENISIAGKVFAENIGKAYGLVPQLPDMKCQAQQDADAPKKSTAPPTVAGGSTQALGKSKIKKGQSGMEKASKKKQRARGKDQEVQVQVEPLPEKEYKLLMACEARYRHNALDSAEAIRTIRDKRLYRQWYPTFSEYCAKRLGISPGRVTQLLKATDVMRNLQVLDGVEQPTTERQVRPLVNLPVDQQQKIWTKAVETTPEGKVSGVIVAEIIEKEGLAPKAKKTTPSFDQEALGKKVLKYLQKNYEVCQKKAHKRYLLDQIGQWFDEHNAEIGRDKQ